MSSNTSLHLMLDTAIVKAIHDDIIKTTGGLPGLSGDKFLGSILKRIEFRIHYENLSDSIEIAAWYGYAIARGHAFIDGNKRTGLVCMDVYLDLVGINIDLQKNPEEVANLIENVAADRIIQQELANWLRNKNKNLRDKK